MPSAWDWKQANQVVTCVLHVENVTFHWSLGFRRLQLPGPEPIGVTGLPFDHARNEACKTAKESGCEWLFFLDSDVIPPPDAVLRLMAHRKPIVSGVYFRRSHPAGVPVMMKPLGHWLVNYPTNALIEVDVVGAGCLLIHRSVLETLPPQRPQEGKTFFDWRVDCKGVMPPEECLSEDFTFCFPKGVWVSGSKLKRIEDVKIGDRVVTHTGSLSRVLDTGRRLYSGEAVRITSSFVRDVTCTASHKFLVRATRPNGRTKTNVLTGTDGVTRELSVEMATKKKLWLEARDVKKGDWLYVPKTKFRKDGVTKHIYLSHFISLRSLTKFSDGTWGYKRTRRCALRLPYKISVTPELCRLLGYFLAEGFCPGKKHTVRFAFHSDEKEYITDCRRLLRVCFGATSTQRREGNATTIIVSSKLLGRLLAALCGTGAHEKHLPRFWGRLDRDCLTEMIKGHWRGDGTLVGGIFSSATMSETLARELQAAVVKLGVLAGIRSYPTEHGLMRLVCIPIVQTDRFSKLVGYDYGDLQVREQDRYVRETKTHFLVQVQSVETFAFEGEVFNIKVAGRESYTANGVAVHNCMWAKKHGIKTLVDTSIECSHVGFGEARRGLFVPLGILPLPQARAA